MQIIVIVWDVVVFVAARTSVKQTWITGDRKTTHTLPAYAAFQLLAAVLNFKKTTLHCFCFVI